MFRRILTLYGIDEEKKFRTFIGDNERSAVQIILSLSLSLSLSKKKTKYGIFYIPFQIKPIASKFLISFYF